MTFDIFARHENIMTVFFRVRVIYLLAIIFAWIELVKDSKPQ